MKRIFSYSLGLISLLLIVMSVCGYTGQLSSVKSFTHTTHNTENKSFYSMPEFPLNLIGNENIQTEIGLNTSASRTNPNTYQYRIIQYQNLTQQRFVISTFWQTSVRQLDESRGYYLFHLCKMLI